jgi:hypothetical protein
MKITAEPRSDQWNADDFIGGPRTFTIAGVKVGTAEQKYDIELVEGEGRSWRPPLTMLRLLIAAWGDDASVWTGRRVTLYRDESVRFGSDAVGGIRISHLSHLPGNKPLSAMLTTTRGRRGRHTVDPLPDAEPTTPDRLGIGALFDKGGLPKDRSDDRMIVTRKIIGRDVAAYADLKPADVDKLQVQLTTWDTEGVLVDKVADILDCAAIEAESDGGEK